MTELGRSGVDRSRLAELLAAEREAFAARNPRSAELAAAAAAGDLFGDVPMTWMAKTAAPFPLTFAAAAGNRVTDVDGHTYVDFCLGDTGAMAGHSPTPTVAAVTRRFAELGGATVMLPSEDATAVAAELSRRFGQRRWSFSLTATDANRWALRLARAVTGRPKVLVNNYCYHGTVDEAFAVDDGSGVRAREGNVGAPIALDATTRVAEFNDVEALQRQLAYGDVAAILMEPALTNMGVVLPAPGYLAAVAELAAANDTLLIIDETHTISAGPGGCTGEWGLTPDVVTIGKAIGGGIPIGAYGLAPGLAERLAASAELDLVDTGGVGGTLAGNALSLAAARATLTEVLTDEAMAAMTALATTYTEGVAALIERSGLPWSVTQLGARAELRFASPAPTDGTTAHDAGDAELEDYLHLYLLNRDLLLTPFHNMTLMCPATTAADVELHLDLLTAAVATLAR